MAMLGASGPSNTVVRIKVNALASLFFIYNLESIVVDEHICRATLEFICRNSLLDRPDGRHNNGVQTFLVNRTLDGNMGKDSILQTWRAVCRKELGILGHLAHRTDALRKTANDHLSKKLRELMSALCNAPEAGTSYQGKEDLNRSKSNEQNTKIFMIHSNFHSKCSAPSSQHCDNEN